MAARFESRILTVVINRPLSEVYAFASTPENFPKWAAGLGQTITRMNDEWIADTPQGPVKIRFTEPNRFGVLDHHVIPESGEELYIPMRVIANGSGTELSFTLFRLPHWSDQQFAEDAESVRRDLQALKRLLEA